MHGGSAVYLPRRMAIDVSLLQPFCCVGSWIREQRPPTESSERSPQRNSPSSMASIGADGPETWLGVTVSLRGHDSCVGVLKNPPFKRPNSATLYLCWIASYDGV